MASRPSETGAVVFYSRFSSDMQNARSCEAQEAELERRAAQDGQDTVQAVRLQDEAISGQEWARPALQDLVRRIEAGAVHRVYVESVDRLSRDPKTQRAS